jgi:hypothetical protein
VSTIHACFAEHAQSLSSPELRENVFPIANAMTHLPDSTEPKHKSTNIVLLTIFQACPDAVRLAGRILEPITIKELSMLKVNAGLTRKIGLPAYGSAGASCMIEIELDQTLVLQDATALQSRLDTVYEICRDAVERELLKYQPPRQTMTVESHSLPENGVKDEGNLACEFEARPQDDGEAISPVNGSVTQGASAVDIPLASDRQINFAYHLARQIRALGGQRLKELSQQFYARPLEELTSREASQLIDLLKDLRAGNQEVSDLLPGAAA